MKCGYVCFWIHDRIEKLKDIDIFGIVHIIIIIGYVPIYYWSRNLQSILSIGNEEIFTEKNRLYSAETGWNAVVNDQIKSADYFLFLVLKFKEKKKQHRFHFIPMNDIDHHQIDVVVMRSFNEWIVKKWATFCWYGMSRCVQLRSFLLASQCFFFSSFFFFLTRQPIIY